MIYQYLYYPHAPLLLRMAKMREVTPWVWRSGNRTGEISDEEIAELEARCLAVVLTKEQGEQMRRIMPELIENRMGYSANLTR